ncbi:MAG: Nramp family divalent metal transporter [Candidatus Peribacteraceae bacterium]|nr:Nramp family divalent metal transporter [Candidatus Peribacteraceae bacterium]MDD5742512.1 Nramp family divalent metal transporter [Candidatus Peribacteraceae bacterium]
MPAKKGAHGPMPLPPAPKLRKILGPSFIILGLGLGSGEVILWPYLASNFGLGMAWAIVLGITMQFFINMEVSRYALIHGESIFVGFAKRWKRLPVWFILSTFFGFGWPGIGLAGATLFAGALGLDNVHAVAIIMFLGIGFFLSIGRVLYKSVERLQMIVIGFGVPFILLLALYLSRSADVVTLAQGLVGQGQGFWFLPAGVPLATFLAALAYSGAGGNLNLAQSCYVRDKGYGMGRYADRITSVITGGGGAEKISLRGSTFAVTEENLKRWKKWWKVTNLEHFLVFWLLGLITMLLLSLLAYVTTFGSAGNAQGIHFILLEASAIAGRTLPVFGMLFLLATGIMLLATQLTVLDSTSRIMTENALLLTRKRTARVSLVYYGILWTQILFGIAVFSLGFDQPRELIVLGACVNAFTMFVYTGLLYMFNNRVLARPLRPSLWRNGVLLASFLFLGFFCGVTVGSYLV